MDVVQQTKPEEIILKAGTIIKVGGFPFRLLKDTPVEGHAANLGLSNLMPPFFIERAVAIQPMSTPAPAKYPGDPQY